MLVPGKLIQPGLMFEGKARSLPKSETPTRQAQALPTKLVILIRLARDKHSSLLQKFINYGRKKFITLAPGDTGIDLMRWLFIQVSMS